MRKLIPFGAALAALLWSTTAWAVVKNAEVTITSGGTPVTGATVTLSTPKPQVRAAAQPSRRPTATRTDKGGKTTITYDDQDAAIGSTVDVTVRTGDGQTHIVRGVSLSALVSGNPIDIAQGPPTIPLAGAGAIYIPGTDIPIILGGYIRHVESGVGDDAGLGVRVIPGDPYFLRFADRIPVTGVQGEVSINRGTWWHTFGASFAKGDERTGVSEPNGGDNIGYVPGDPNLGAGVIFGNTGSSATGEVSLTEFNLNYKVMQPFNLQNGFGWGWDPTSESRKAFGFIFGYSFRDLDYNGHLQRDADPNNVFVDVSHGLRTHRLTFGPAVYGERMVGNGWFLHGKADAQVGFMRSTLHAEEVACLGCGGVNPTESSIHDSQTSFAWNAKAQAGFGYQFTPNFKLIVGAEAWVGNRHVLNTRRNPTDGGTGIGTSTEDEYGAFVRLVYLSDSRLKRDVEQVGRLANGLALYRYRYLWSGTEYVGVMAQEVAAYMPDGVVRGADGFLRVDYGRLGTRLMTWDEWRGPSLKEMANAAF